MVRESLKGQRVVSRARMLLNEEIKEGTISEVHDSEITVKWDAEYGTSSFMRPMEPKYSRHEIGPNMDIIVLTDDGPDAPDETGLIQFEPVQNNPIQILFLFIVNILSNQKSFDYHQALVPIILQVRDPKVIGIFRPSGLIKGMWTLGMGEMG